MKYKRVCAEPCIEVVHSIVHSDVCYEHVPSISKDSQVAIKQKQKQKTHGSDTGGSSALACRTLVATD